MKVNESVDCKMEAISYMYVVNKLAPVTLSLRISRVMLRCTAFLTDSKMWKGRNSSL
jgi:hypothetical protein